MKSYTDIEQSRKLAEFLPLDSADMEYLSIKENGLLVGNVPFVKDDSEVENSAYSRTYDRIACWSLSALLSVLPKDTDIVKEEADTENEQYMCTVGVKSGIISTFGNNPVDACYEMIIRLNELKLL